MSEEELKRVLNEELALNPNNMNETGEKAYYKLIYYIKNLQDERKDLIGKIGNKDNVYFKIGKDTNIYNLYDFIKNNLPFEKAICLYKLLQNKMITLEDKIIDYSACSDDGDK